VSKEPGSRVVDAQFSRTSVQLIQQGIKTQTRRLAAASLRIRLPAMVTSDLPELVKPVLRVGAGIHRAKLNPLGAVFVETPRGNFGIKPGEFQFRCPWIPYGETVLGDFGNGKRGWMVVPKHGPQRVRVLETWRTHERPDDAVDGILFAADGAFVPIQNTSEAGTNWVVAHDNGKHGDRWRPPIFLPRWAVRIELLVSLARLVHLQDITREDAIAEGVTFTDYGKNEYGTPKAGWRFGPSHHSDQCLSSPVTAFGNGWNRLHAGENWNLKSGPSPWDENPWVWAYTFARRT